VQTRLATSFASSTSERYLRGLENGYALEDNDTHLKNRFSVDALLGPTSKAKIEGAK
jgi:hypothetical protein